MKRKNILMISGEMTLKKIQKHILLATSLLIGTLFSCGTESTFPPGLAKIGAELNSAFDLQAKGDNEGAKAAYQKVLEEQPRDISTRLNLANLQLNTGETEKAISTFQSILEDDSENVIASSGLAASLEKAGRSDEAQKVRAKSSNGLQASSGTGEQKEVTKPDFLGKEKRYEIGYADPVYYNADEIRFKMSISQVLDISDNTLIVKYSENTSDVDGSRSKVFEYEYRVPITNIGFIGAENSSVSGDSSVIANNEVIRKSKLSPGTALSIIKLNDPDGVYTDYYGNSFGDPEQTDNKAMVFKNGVNNGKIRQELFSRIPKIKIGAVNDLDSAELKNIENEFDFIYPFKIIFVNKSNGYFSSLSQIPTNQKSNYRAKRNDLVRKVNALYMNSASGEIDAATNNINLSSSLEGSMNEVHPDRIRIVDPNVKTRNGQS